MLSLLTHAISFFIFAFLLFEPLLLSAGYLSKHDETQAASDYEYEGWNGLHEQFKAVRSKAADEISKAGANIGIAVGGLASNAAFQSLKQTLKMIESGRNDTMDRLERMQKSGIESWQKAEEVVTNTGMGLSSHLESLSDLLEGVSSTVRKRRKRKLQVSAEQQVDEVPNSTEEFPS